MNKGIERRNSIMVTTRAPCFIFSSDSLQIYDRSRTTGIPKSGKNMTRDRFPLNTDSILRLIPQSEGIEADNRGVNILEAKDVSRINNYVRNGLKAYIEININVLI